MADVLIMGMEMPKTCRRCMEMEIPIHCRVMKEEPVTAVMSGYDIPSDCPIVEIPYELVNFIIAMSQLPREEPKTATEAKEALAYEELERRMRKDDLEDNMLYKLCCAKAST